MLVYLSLGSNIHPREEYINKACSLIEERVGHICARSYDHYSQPWGYDSQNQYLNIALKVQTALQPLALLTVTEQIERELGRKEKNHYADRTIDIDIIFYFLSDGSALQMNTPRLTIPHPYWHERDFVLKPLLTILATENEASI
ncbi:MAG: 2-amino-4-hydroxy-6-hydroxymethyldihydropteridine diphosphokinase [Paludibacteraceae bacterium]|nr:2-amino-4-hydroxy-6-hydroxymethyldihydropteridine diphosphokinase [Paludibacteraceae bacterium]